MDDHPRRAPRCGSTHPPQRPLRPTPDRTRVPAPPLPHQTTTPPLNPRARPPPPPPLRATHAPHPPHTQPSHQNRAPQSPPSYSAALLQRPRAPYSSPPPTLPSPTGSTTERARARTHTPHANNLAPNTTKPRRHHTHPKMPTYTISIHARPTSHTPRRAHRPSYRPHALHPRASHTAPPPPSLRGHLRTPARDRERDASHIPQLKTANRARAQTATQISPSQRVNLLIYQPQYPLNQTTRAPLKITLLLSRREQTNDKKNNTQHLLSKLNIR